ncbi:MAG TPA: hypothetical protein VHD32_05535 [Candidatus Didemnitutus sp.]|nr:hypothetical protein [Candidatus Didemnitutus sp.]
MKILCLFVRFGEDHHAGSLDVLNAWYERHGLREARTLWIVDNALAPDTPPRALGPRDWLRAGDNSAWEFSAWERALREAEGEPFDLVHFVTSSFNTLYTGYLGHFRPEMLQAVNTRRVCLGHIDGHPSGFELGGRHFDRWLRTCFFFLNRRDALAVRTWVAFGQADLLFASSGTIEFRREAPLSEAYRRHVTAWLRGAEIGGHRWHSPVAGGTGEVRRFQSKALAITNEHALSLTLRDAGLALADLCWLHLQPAPANPSARVAPEKEQVEARNRFLGIPG